MQKNFKDIFNNQEVELPSGLRQAVLGRIEKEKMKSMARKKIYLKVGFGISGISSVIAGITFGKEILSSEFFSIVLLGFSDAKTVMALWQDYAYSLLETLPTVEFLLILTPIFVILLLAKKYEDLQYNLSFKN